MSNIEPSQRSFNDIEQVAIDVLNKKAPTVMTKTGSVVRELVIRPLAYIASWVTDNIDATIEKSSLSYLASSQATDNAICDDIASMFFVQRRQGTYAKGIITLTLNSAIVTIPNGATFIVDNITLKTNTQYIITNAKLVSNTSADVVYLTSIPVLVDDTMHYIANIPVQATDTGAIEIPAGIAVTMGFAGKGIVSAELTSPITGGSGVETDAELVKRAEYTNAAAGVGTYYGIQKKLNNSPVAVLGMAVVSGEDTAMHRGRYNTININPGGVVDCYIKTSNQPVTELITVNCNDGYIEISDKKYANILAVKQVIVNGVYLQDLSVEFGSSNIMLDSVSARLSVDQLTIIRGEGIVKGATATVSIVYMPNLREVQDYLDSDTEKFVGQDIQVKAAVPVGISIDCCAKKDDGEVITNDEVNILKDAISSYINSIPVGTATINYSDMRRICRSVLPTVDLRLPCTFSCIIYLKDGSMDSFYSNTGILDISNTVNQGYWDYNVCYFFSCTSNIRIETL